MLSKTITLTALAILSLLLPSTSPVYASDQRAMRTSMTESNAVRESILSMFQHQSISVYLPIVAVPQETQISDGESFTLTRRKARYYPIDVNLQGLPSEAFGANVNGTGQDIDSLCGTTSTRSMLFQVASHADSALAGQQDLFLQDSTNVFATTCTVTKATDSGTGSLRDCLVKVTSGSTINFDPKIFPSASPVSIILSNPLPSITTNNLTLDASTAGVILDGSGLISGSGLVISSAHDVTVRGLLIAFFPKNGIELINGASNVIIGGDRTVGVSPLGQGNLISGNGSAGIQIAGLETTGNRILGNYIGTNIAGTVAISNLIGISINSGAHHNRIGGDTSSTRNLISGNSGFGVSLAHSNTVKNQIQGNLIGTNAAGTDYLANGVFGLFVGFGANDNLIGGSTQSAFNLISGNDDSGVCLQDSPTTNNRILGNYIGTNIAGTDRLDNTFHGIVIASGANNNLIGGEALGERNLISGNNGSGIRLKGAATTGNKVIGNYIGTDMTGSGALSNGASGITFQDGAHHNIIGGYTAGTRNLISGNRAAGVALRSPGTTQNEISGNFIGTNVAGTEVLSNTLAGVVIIDGASNNIIGGDSPGERNLISGNGRVGVWLQDPTTTGNLVSGNFIGTNVSGTVALGNRENGINIWAGASSNIIGGDYATAGNLISGNGHAGIHLQGADPSQGIETTGNRILGNFIGTNMFGTEGLGNKAEGIFAGFNIKNTIIGGESPSSRNLISNNGGSGVVLQNAGTTGNQILGNYIGTNLTGTDELGNMEFGVVILAGASDNTVGGEMQNTRNLISGNRFTGVIIQDPKTTGNRVLGNYIGVNLTGTNAIGNGLDGVTIGFGASNNIIGGSISQAGNVISGNKYSGIQIQNNGTISNQIRTNIIGLDATGTFTIGNRLNGIVIMASASNNIIGGETAGVGNLISGNGTHGVHLQDTNTVGNQVLGNYIGTDITGNLSLGNSESGVFIHAQASQNVIGGNTPKARNIISGNGIEVWIQGSGTSSNQIAGNYIGADVTGMKLVGPGLIGVSIDLGAEANIIGGEIAGAGNLISGNLIGVLIENAGTNKNRVLGNYIGTDTTGKAMLVNSISEFGVAIIPELAQLQFRSDATTYIALSRGNTQTGDTNADMAGPSGNIIGGETPGARNLISGNGMTGVQIEGVGTTENEIKGNYIGTDITGMSSLGIGDKEGVFIGFGAHHNIVGGQIDGARNIISGNGRAGILFGNQAHHNTVQGNYIGTDISGMITLGNKLDGVAFTNGANSNIVGGEVTGAGNLISGNGNNGVRFEDIGTMNNQVVGNVIGANATATAPIPNAKNGIVFTEGAHSNTIGPGNQILYNTLAGVFVDDETSIGNKITQNMIYSNGGTPIDWAVSPAPSERSPVLTTYSATDLKLTGRACGNCRVEVFANPDPTPAARSYIGAVNANANGDFTLIMPSQPVLPYLTAVEIRPNGTTLEFSDSFKISAISVYLPIIAG